MRKPIIGVMGPGHQATAVDLKTAHELGQRIAQQGWILLTGGRNAGVMDASSRGAKQANGLTVGILPDADLSNMSIAIDIPIVTGMGSGRNAINVLSSDVVIACGMGQGTASEVALALKAQKPVILLQSNPSSQAFFQSLTDHPVWIAAHAQEAITIARSLLDQTFSDQV